MQEKNQLYMKEKACQERFIKQSEKIRAEQEVSQQLGRTDQQRGERGGREGPHVAAAEDERELMTEDKQRIEEEGGAFTRASLATLDSLDFM